MEVSAGKELLESQNMHIETIDVSAHPEYKGHEYVFRASVPDQGFTAFIAVHSTALGPGEGGIRYKHYATEDEAITDVLRLSEGMTLKNAAAGLSAGGGKSVIMAHEDLPKPDEAVLEMMAEALNRVNTPRILYYGAEDMNVSEDNLDYMASFTSFLKGMTATSPGTVGGNPSPLTALGVFEAMKTAVEEKFGGKKTLADLTVALQGIGSVGAELAWLLHGQGAKLVASDTSDKAFTVLKMKGVEIERVGLEDIYDVNADIFAPNAIGGTLTNETVERLHKAGVQIVCGAANNQQRDQVGHVQSRKMQECGILYCPDFIVNAGGIIWVNQVGKNADEVRERVRAHMPESLRRIIALQKETGRDMGCLAEDYALGLVDKMSGKSA